MEGPQFTYPILRFAVELWMLYVLFVLPLFIIKFGKKSFVDLGPTFARTLARGLVIALPVGILASLLSFVLLALPSMLGWESFYLVAEPPIELLLHILFDVFNLSISSGFFVMCLFWYYIGLLITFVTFFRLLVTSKQMKFVAGLSAALFLIFFVGTFALNRLHDSYEYCSKQLLCKRDRPYTHTYDYR